MRIVATSDLHGTLPRIDPCDLLILGGDLCPDYLRQYQHGANYGAVRFDKGEEKQAKWLDTEFRAWLEQVPAETIVGIAGNHDFVFEKPRLIPDLPWVYLRDSEVDVDGLRIYGTPWVPNLQFWAFYASDNALQARAESIPEGVDILISHGPPYGFGDRCGPGAFSAGQHVGENALEIELVRIKARWLICGHIHGGYGRFPHPSGTVIHNVSLNNEQYEPVQPPVTIFRGEDD